jgi:ribosome modulation factor
VKNDKCDAGKSDKEINLDNLPLSNTDYLAGKLAFNEDQSEETCPYPIGDNRRAYWLKGWYDSRTSLWLQQFDKRQAERAKEREQKK